MLARMLRTWYSLADVRHLVGEGAGRHVDALRHQENVRAPAAWPAERAWGSVTLSVQGWRRRASSRSWCEVARPSPGRAALEWPETAEHAKEARLAGRRGPRHHQRPCGGDRHADRARDALPTRGDDVDVREHHLGPGVVEDELSAAGHAVRGLKLGHHLVQLADPRDLARQRRPGLTRPLDDAARGAWGPIARSF